MRVISGKAVGRANCSRYDVYNIFTNFDHYNLPHPCISCQSIHSPSFTRPIFDAIICDPPYGIRAVSKKEVEDGKTISENYDVDEIYESLLE
jgi:tRNA G10  N-methylase Trm11